MELMKLLLTLHVEKVHFKRNMQKLSVSLIIAGCIATMATSCNDSKDNDDAKVVYGSTAITSFSLEKNDSVLANLDSVFFSIDLVNGRIFNADSLPVGTRINRLIINIGTPNISACEVTYNRGEQGDTTINYLSHATDSIDFSHGPATVKITSYDGEATRSYKVYVNVHTTKPDSMTWTRTATAKLPSTLTGIISSKTVSYNGGTACLSANATEAEIATATNPESDWNITKVALPQGARIATFTASSDKFYIIGESDKLYMSADSGNSWSDTGKKMTWIYAPVENGVTGTVKRPGGYMLVSYPDGTETPAPADMPVSGTSDAVTYTNKWMTGTLTVIACGEKADGTLSGDTWGYDGQSWQCLGHDVLPKMTGVSLFPYFTFKTDDRWVTTEYTALFAVGGRHESGLTDKTIYVSNDNGLHWHRGSTEIQMPESTPPFYGAQAIIYNDVMTTSSGSLKWALTPQRRLAPWWTFSNETASRGNNPWDTWTCTYVYLFGGYNMAAGAYSNVWRGVINRLTFKPLH